MRVSADKKRSICEVNVNGRKLDYTADFIYFGTV